MPIYFCDRTRHVILLLTTAGLTLMMSNTLVFNFTNICMAKDDDNDKAINGTLIPLFTASETNTIVSGTAFGCLLGAIPVTYITNRCGLRIMFTGYGMLGAISILITPFLVSFGVLTMFVLRIFQGIPMAASFVSMASITTEWSPLSSTGMYLSWMSCNIQFGAIFTMPTAGYLCGSRLGWQSVYYLHGVLSILIFTIFYYFFRDSPREQCNVSPKELGLIEIGKLLRDPEDRRNVPYAKMLTDPMIWIILLAFFSSLVGLYLFIQYGPIYLNKTLKMNVQETGVSSAIPFVLSCALKMIAGPMSDRCVFLSEKTRIIIFASVSQFLMAGCYIALALFPSDWELSIKTCFAFVIVFSGLNVVGVIKSAQEVARYYSHVIMAWVTFLIGIIIILLPVTINILVPNYEQGEWSMLFIYTAIIIIFGNIVFIFSIDARPRSWAVETAALNYDTAVTPEITAQSPEINDTAIEKYNASSEGVKIPLTDD